MKCKRIDRWLLASISALLSLAITNSASGTTLADLGISLSNVKSQGPSIDVQIIPISPSTGFTEKEWVERDQFIKDSTTRLRMLYKNPSDQEYRPNFLGQVPPLMMTRILQFVSRDYSAQGQIRRITSLALFKARRLGIFNINIEIPPFSELRGLDAASFVQGIGNSIYHSNQPGTPVTIHLIHSDGISGPQSEAIDSELKKPFADMDDPGTSGMIPQELQISPKTSGLVIFPYDSSTNHLVEARFLESLEKGWNRLREPGSGLSAQWLEGKIVAGINFTGGDLATLGSDGLFKPSQENIVGARFQSTLFWGRLKRVVPNHLDSFGFWATIDTKEGERTFSIRSTSLVHVFPTTEDDQETKVAQDRYRAYMKILGEKKRRQYEEWRKNQNVPAIVRKAISSKNKIDLLYLPHDLMNLAQLHMDEAIGKVCDFLLRRKQWAQQRISSPEPPTIDSIL